MNRLLLAIAIVWAMGAVTMVGAWPMPSQQASAIQISIASGGNKEEWLHQAVAKFNAASQRDTTLQLEGQPIFVEIIQECIDGRCADYRSGSMVADVLAGKIKPTIISPGEESWTLKFQREWQAKYGKGVARDVGPTLVRTPLVVATWLSRARALGCWPAPEPDCTWGRIRTLATSPDGWGLLGHPEWGKFKFGYGYVGEANTGTLGAVLMCMLGAGKAAGLTTADVGVSTGCGQFLAGIERAKVHSGQRSDWLQEQMTNGGPEYLDAIVAYELDVILANQTQRQNLREPLVAVYPQDGTIVVGHPFTILEGVPWVTSQQAAAAKVFQQFLLSNELQRAVLPTGLRPADPSVPLGSPIDFLNGANPRANLVALDVPEGAVIDRIVEVWHKVKKHAVVAIVFDKSGGMAGAKMDAARTGAQEFVRRMDCDDRLIWRPFDGTLYPPAEGYGCDRADLIAKIGATPAGGGNALYDAILAAYDQLEGIRRTRGDALRYGIVVLSDGRDTDSRTSLSALKARLSLEEADPTGIQIHTIAIGPDADEDALWKIAGAHGRRSWKGQTAGDMVAVYKAIATYY